MAGKQTVTVSVLADTKQFAAAMKGIGVDTDSIGNSMKKLGAIVATAFSVDVVARFAASTIKAASDLNETTAAVGQVFGEAASQLEAFAKTAPTALGQTSTQFLGAAKTFGIFGKAAGLANQENADFSKNLAVLATDLASFNNTSVDDAITALGAALRGESEPIRRYGILLDDATLKATALEMGIYDGNGALSQQQRVLAANQQIFKQSTVQQGDFIRTQDGMANSTKSLTAQFGELKIQIGEALLPAVETILPVMTDLVTSLQANPEFNAFLVDMGNNFANILPNLLGTVTNILTLVGENGIPLINSLLPLANELLNTFGILLGQIAAADSRTALGGVAGGINDVTSAVQGFNDALQGFFNWFNGLPNWAKFLLSPLLSGTFGGSAREIQQSGDLLGYLQSTNVNTRRESFMGPTVSERGATTININGNVGYDPTAIARELGLRQAQANSLNGLNGIIGVR